MSNESNPGPDVVDPNSEVVGVDITSGEGNEPAEPESPPAPPQPEPPEPEPAPESEPE